MVALDPGHGADSDASATPDGLRVPRASSWVRSVLWDQLVRLGVGGVGVAGELPPGAAVVVANHASHADTAALMAALGRRHAVLVVAGADYWRGWRGWLARHVVGILPVAREGGFPALLDGAAGHLRSGGVVVVYPEGTRSAGGAVGRFRSGAVRLARATGAPIVPVGIRGTRELYGKGRLVPDLAAAARAPLGVRIGDAVPGADLDDPAAPVRLREAVCRLADAPAPPVCTSATWEWARANLSGLRGAAFAFGWGFAEGLFFPVVAECGLVPVAFAHGRHAWPAVGAAAAGSVAGVAANRALARAGVWVPWPLTTPEMHDAARDGLRRDVAAALRQQRGNGVPVKVYARLAGEHRIPAREFLPAAAAARASRIVPVGTALLVVGDLASRRLRVGYGAALTVVGAGVAVGLELVIRSWKRYR